MKVPDLGPALGVDLVTAAKLHNLAEQERSRLSGAAEAKAAGFVAGASSGPVSVAHPVLSTVPAASGMFYRPQQFVTATVYGDGQAARRSSPYSSHYPTAYPVELKTSFPEYEGEYMRTIQELNEVTASSYNLYNTNCCLWTGLCPCFLGMTLIMLCDDSTMDGRDDVLKKLNEINARPHDSYGFRVQFAMNPAATEDRKGKRVRVSPSLSVNMTRLR